MSEEKDWKVDTWDVHDGVRIPRGSKAVMQGDYCVAIILADNDKPAESRVHLIASAPELYEALKEARDCVAECANYESSDKRRPDRMQSTLKILEMVDIAIQKAEGRS
jgi:hypothetical protein